MMVAVLACRAFPDTMAALRRASQLLVVWGGAPALCGTWSDAHRTRLPPAYYAHRVRHIPAPCVPPRRRHWHHPSRLRRSCAFWPGTLRLRTPHGTGAAPQQRRRCVPAPCARLLWLSKSVSGDEGIVEDRPQSSLQVGATGSATRCPRWALAVCPRGRPPLSDSIGQDLLRTTRPD